MMPSRLPPNPNSLSPKVGLSVGVPGLAVNLEADPEPPGSRMSVGDPRQPLIIGNANALVPALKKLRLVIPSGEYLLDGLVRGCWIEAPIRRSYVSEFMGNPAHE
jgi:hypothetical protein